MHWKGETGMKKVLVVIDMQNDFVTGALGSQAAQAVVQPIVELLEEYRAKGWPVIYTADTHPPEEYELGASQESGRIPRHCVKGETGWEIVPVLAPQAGEQVVEKPSFLSLDLAEAIGKLEKEDVIVLCGVCTDICVVSNALHLRAQYPNNAIAVLKDACAGTSEQSHNGALAVMQSCLIDVE